MKASSLQGFMDSVRKAGPGSVFLACGTEQVQLSRVRDAVRRRFCSGLGFEYGAVPPDEAEPGLITRMLEEPSLFAPGRLLRLPEADRLPAAVRRELVEAASAPGRVDAILVESTETALRNSFNASLDGLPGTVSYVCWDPFEKDMPGWCDVLAGEHGLALTAGSRSALVAWAGGSLSRLDDAVRTAAVFSGGRTLSQAEMAGLLTGVADPGVFDLADEIWAGRRGRAMALAWRLLQAGEEPVALLALIQRQWEKLEAARSILAAGGGRREIERETGLPRGASDRLADAAAKTSVPPQWIASEALASSDHQLKTGGEPFTVFAALIHSLTPEQKVY